MKPVSSQTSGPERIVVTKGAGEYCQECYLDIKSPFDEDYDMYTIARKTEGRCACCGLLVIAGNPIDPSYPDEVTST